MKISTILMTVLALVVCAGCSSQLQLKKLTDDEFVELGRQTLKANRITNIAVENNYGYIKITGIKPSGKHTRFIETTVVSGRDQTVNRSAVEEYRVKYYLLIESFTQPENGRTIEIKGYLPMEVPPDPQLPPDNPDAGATNQLKWIPSDPRVNMQEMIIDAKATFHRLWQESSMAAAGIAPAAPVAAPPEPTPEPNAEPEAAEEPWTAPASDTPAIPPAENEAEETEQAEDPASPAETSTDPPDAAQPDAEQPDAEQPDTGQPDANPVP
jgi:hypothetical protein